jgi:hypothetical protein
MREEYVLITKISDCLQRINDCNLKPNFNGPKNVGSEESKEPGFEDYGESFEGPKFLEETLFTTSGDSGEDEEKED